MMRLKCLMEVFAWVLIIFLFFPLVSGWSGSQDMLHYHRCYSDLQWTLTWRGVSCRPSTDVDLQAWGWIHHQWFWSELNHCHYISPQCRVSAILSSTFLWNLYILNHRVGPNIPLGIDSPWYFYHAISYSEDEIPLCGQGLAICIRPIHWSEAYLLPLHLYLYLWQHPQAPGIGRSWSFKGRSSYRSSFRNSYSNWSHQNPLAAEECTHEGWEEAWSLDPNREEPAQDIATH